MKGYCHRKSADRLHSAALESEMSINTHCFALNIVYKIIQTHSLKKNVSTFSLIQQQLTEITNFLMFQRDDSW